MGKGRRDRGTGWAPEPRANPEEKGARGHPPSARSPCAREITPAGGAWPLDEGKRGCRGKLERGLASGPGANPKSGFENQSWHQATRLARTGRRAPRCRDSDFLAGRNK